MSYQYNRYTKSQFTEHNNNEYDRNNYTNAYSPSFNVKHSIDQEKNIEYEETYHYVTVSSRDRDTSIYPNTNRYVINFPKEFKNISSIQLIQAIFPDTNNVRHEPYLLLKIDELEDVMVSNDRNISDAFAMILLSAPPQNNTFITMDTKVHENTIKYFRIPKATLSKMTISITDCDGALFDFGSDSPPLVKGVQTTFVFKLSVLEKKRETLNHRNVF